MAGEWRFPNRATAPGSTHYYSIRFAPRPLRDGLAIVTAWRHEVRDILRTVSDPGVARLKLDWWREEFARIVAGAPRHPLSRALQPVLVRHSLPPEPFLAIANGVEAELRRQVPADRHAWQEAEEQDRGALFELLARCHGLTDASSLHRARRTGSFCGQVYRIRDAGPLLRAGRAVIPTSDLTAAGLGPGPLGSSGRVQELRVLLADIGAAVREYRAATDEAHLPLCLRIQVRILEALHAELSAAGYAVVEQRIGLTPLRKLWLAWRESRRAQATTHPL